MSNTLDGNEEFGGGMQSLCSASHLRSQERARSIHAGDEMSCWIEKPMPISLIGIVVPDFDRLVAA